MEQLFDDPVARGEIDESVPCLLITWRGYAPSVAYRRVLELSLTAWQAAQRKQPPARPLRGAIADTRLFTALAPEDQAWAVTSWNPRILAAGLRRIAFIIPASIFGQLAVTDTLSQTDAAGQLLETALFDDLENARQWLRTG